MRKKLASIPWFTMTLFLAGAVALFERLTMPYFINFYQDDAFYYFQIARNIVSHHGSSFDGTHLTNGYHPLWLLTLVVLTFISTGKFLFVLLQTVALISFITTFLAARTVFRYFSNDLVITQIAAAGVALQSLMILLSGMEITLTLPLVLLLCWYRLRPQFRWTPTIAAGYGMLCALVILSRLDTAVFIVVLFFLELLLDRPASSQEWWSRLTALFSVAIPVSLYLLSNRVWFHVWMPISGEAKQLRMHHGFTLGSLKIALGPINLPYQFLIVYPALIITLLCIALALSPGRLRVRRANLIVSLSLIFLPFLQFLAFVTTSDWPIWPWYLYSCPLAMTGGFLLCFNMSRQPEAFARKRIHLIVEGSLLAVAFLFALKASAGGAQAPWYLFGKDVEAFARTHQGIYAMGDCAGTPAYLTQQPFVQLEGLVMDPTFLQNIRDRRNLNDVMKAYNVRYYVTINDTLVDGCYRTIEPFMAGPDSPHMSGIFCQAPIASTSHGAIRVDIFDLQPNAGIAALSR